MAEDVGDEGAFVAVGLPRVVVVVLTLSFWFAFKPETQRRDAKQLVGDKTKGLCQDSPVYKDKLAYRLSNSQEYYTLIGDADKLTLQAIYGFC